MLMGFNGYSRWVVDVDVLVRILLIVHFGKLRHGYFEINVRNGKAGRLLM